MPKSIRFAVLPFALLACGATPPACAQDFAWAGAAGGAELDGAGEVAVDGSGNVYAAGWFRGTADFDPGPGASPLTTGGKFDAWILKLDAAGQLLWARQIAGPEDTQATAVALDAAGNVYVTGSSAGIADFDPGPGSFPLGIAQQIPRAFVLKLDAGGNFVWAVDLGGASLMSSSGDGIGLDGAGNVLVAGGFSGTGDFDPGPGTFNQASAGQSDLYVLKLDAGGVFQWAKRAGAAFDDRALGLAVDATGAALVAGLFFGTVDFDPGPGTANLTSAGQDAFVLALDAAGGFLWADRLGGPNSDSAADVRLDPSGGLYVAGQFAGSIDLDPGPAAASVPAAGANDIFLVKLDGAGGFVRGAGFGGAGSDSPAGLAVNPLGPVYLTGSFRQTVDFDPGPGSFTLASRALSDDAFVLKLDAAGAFAWVVQLGGADNEAGAAVAVDGTTGVVSLGTFSGTGDFDPGVGTAPLASAGFVDAYVSKLTDAFAAPVVRHVPADHPTIQAAIDAARHLDTIRVAPGTYFENLDFHGQHVALESEAGPEATVLDGSGAGPVVTFANGEDGNAVVQGFTITHGLGTVQRNGGGVSISGFASPRILGNVITGNLGASFGGGIGVSGGAAVIQGNVIRDNHQDPGFSGGPGGGGIGFVGSSARILDNAIEDNSWGSGGSGGGISFFGSSADLGSPLVQGNAIRGNLAPGKGGGVSIVNATEPNFVQNLVAGNRSTQGGGFYWRVVTGSRGPALASNTIADNDAPEGSGIYADGPQGQVRIENEVIRALPGQAAVFCGAFTTTPPIFRFNDVFTPGGPAYGGLCGAPAGAGNLSLDPRFADTVSGDYRLWPLSPAVDAGDNAALPAGLAADLDGRPRRQDVPDRPDTGTGPAPVVDMGAFELGTGTDFFTLAPCRLLDTRGGAPLTAQLAVTFEAAGACGIPAAARALAVNVTAAEASGEGFVELYPGNLDAPGVSLINFHAGKARANNAVVRLATDGAGTLGARAFVQGNGQAGTVHLIVDVVGYFR